MGGMIGQTMALSRPDRVRTLTSMSSTTGNPALPPPTPEALSVITVPPPSDRAGFIDYFFTMWKILNGRFPVDETRVARYAELTYDRGKPCPGHCAANCGDQTPREAEKTHLAPSKCRRSSFTATQTPLFAGGMRNRYGGGNSGGATDDHRRGWTLHSPSRCGTG